VTATGGPEMARRRLRVECLDDGQTVAVVVQREEMVGNVEIGPISVVESSVLSFPVDDVDQWQRDMLVLVLEHL
jgi:hypothetical protein